MIDCLKAGERPEPARQPWQIVDVDVPAVAAMLGIVLNRRSVQVSDPGGVQRRSRRDFHVGDSERAAPRMGRVCRQSPAEEGIGGAFIATIPPLNLTVTT
jgi:hypothetical protein